METLILDGKNFTLSTLQNIFLNYFSKKTNSSHSLFFALGEEGKQNIIKARDLILSLTEQEDPPAVYGINTGFGSLSNKSIPKNLLEKLQKNLIYSHCTGTGDYLQESTCFLVLFLRLHCFLKGHSGVSLAVIERLLFFLNHKILPTAPEKGSVGASGDLAPLSHMALALLGEGMCWFEGKITPTTEIYKRYQLSPLTLGAKEGLALINGTTVMTALGLESIWHSQILCATADLIGAFSLEGLRGTSTAFLSKIHEVRPHAGQLKVAQNLQLLLANSEIAKSHKNCSRVQDPYSFRCMPQVHGASRQTLKHAEEIFEIEINSVTDNPLIFTEENQFLSGGNFHGAPLALSLDYLAIGMHELGSISERRLEKLINPIFSELPAFLCHEPGVESGLMITQVTAAALVSENKIFCHPASIDSIPTSTDKEDHVSMGVTAGLKLRSVLKNVQTILSIETLGALCALDFLRPLKTSPALELFYECLRKKVPPVATDRIFSEDIKVIEHLLFHETPLVLEIKKFLKGHLR